ncbi:hypothetical protein Cfor_05576 [Coptotermes formosanus]|uniref:Reverse transcriptase domain-containing protein n=1 Tax=Coptotermes formosanus TaxID=36987 RepID=A0A6L2PRC2_COPFO|nr:hypothetical protein Cfor_05576 [Coptotermes formosanus]
MLQNTEAGVRIRRRQINNPQYADDTTLLAENKDHTVKLIKRVKTSSEKAGFKLNLKKTRVLSTGEQVNLLVDGQEISAVTSYKILGVLITNTGYSKHKIKRKIRLGRAAMAKLSKIMKDRELRPT